MPRPDQKTPEERLWISDKTKIKVSIAGVLAICATICGSTWAARGYLESWKADLADHFAVLQKSQDDIVAKLNATNNALGYKWTASQMEQWANQLDKTNRDVQRTGGINGLNVPDPLSIIPRPAP